jgi:hypothetical protein
VRATQTWLTLVVTAALAAGMLAFLVATPDPSGRVTAGDVGFTRMDERTVFAAMGHAAEHHRAAHRSTMGGRAAATTGRAWLDALPGSRARTRAVPANVALASGPDANARRVAAFVRWADDLPARRWRATANSPLQVAGEELRWTVTGELTIDVAQAVSRTRRQVVPVEL